MTHVSYRDAGDLDVESDFVVVGSGAAGAAAASVLARAGRSVTIVEAGAWREPDDYPVSTYGSLRDLMDHFGANVTRGRALWPIVQARCVGGTTVVNSAICVPTPADVFERWSREHGVPLSLRERVWAHQQDLERELSVAETAPELGLSNRLAMAGATNLGWESHYTRRYVKGCAGSGQCMQGCKELKKQSTNITLIPEVLERGGTVLSSAPVDRVVFEGRRAIGVKGRFEHPRTKRRGGRFFARARRGVIVAASVTHTPVLLARSGVKHPRLGLEFRAHPGTGVFGCYDEPVDQNVGATQGWASTHFRESPGLKLETLSIPLELVASRFSGGGQELMKRLSEYRHVAMWCHAVRAETAGSVRPPLAGRTPVVSYTLDDRDMRKLRQGVLQVARCHVAAGAKAVLPGVVGLPFRMAAGEIDQLEDAPLDPRAYVAILSHLFGGAVMGADPERSVVDPSGRVRGHDGLLVADASIIPTNLGVNPQHTIMALARCVAEDALSVSAR